MTASPPSQEVREEAGRIAAEMQTEVDALDDRIRAKMFECARLEKEILRLAAGIVALEAYLNAKKAAP